MTKTSKIFLTISIIALASSFTEAGGSIGWGILRPIGAVAFIAFFITNLLAKEVALYEEEERKRQGQAENVGQESARVMPSLKVERRSASLKTATANQSA